jgi:GNAT superfamily N-acetyltransferase
MMTVRPAQEQDLPHLPEIEAATAKLFAPLGLDELFSPSADRLAQIRPYFDAGHIWVAVYDDGDPVGFAMAAVIDGGAHLEEVDVLPDYGRRGIGSALIERVCQWARDHELATIALSTQKNVPWNMPFYEKLGFVVVPDGKLTAAYLELRQHERALGLPVEDRVIMKKIIKHPPRAATR